MKDTHTEKLEIFNEDEIKIGEVSRDEIHKEGLLHRQIQVWLYTPDGKIIFQKRAKNKDTYPGLFDASVGGHVDPGLRPIESALLELNEEAGISASSEDLIFIEKQRFNAFDDLTSSINNVFQYVYSYFYDGNISDLVVEEGKAEGFQMFSLSELKEMEDVEREAFIGALLNEDFMNLYKKILDNLETKNQK